MNFHDTNYFIPHMEWEVPTSPLCVETLDFELTNWSFSKDATIEIRRNMPDFGLSAVIRGNVTEFSALEQAPYIGVGNIIEGQTIKGIDRQGNRVEMQGCLLGGFRTSSLKFGFIEAEVIVDSYQIIYKDFEESSITHRLEWLVCSEFSAHLPHSTLRSPGLDGKKLRRGVDDLEDGSFDNVTARSSTRDFTRVKCNGIDFLLAIVPKEIIKGDYTGVCLEFRNQQDRISEETLSSICHFFSFLLGCKLTHIGNSLLAGQELKEANFYSRRILKLHEAMPPIRFNSRYEWGNFSFLVDKYLTRFLELNRSYSLQEALSRYWIARETPVGVNLPLLASALEIIASSYFKENKTASSVYMAEKDYLSAIEQELFALQIKLKDITGGHIMLNKIKGAYRKSINEKMTDFFLGIDIEIGKDEKEALLLRNKMTHGSRDYSDLKRVYKDLKLTRVYEVLFHRVILSILGYRDYYIDYSIRECLLKPISMPAGDL